MKNKTEFETAQASARCLKLEIDASEFHAFPHVSDFVASALAGNGELRCDDKPAVLSAAELCRDDVSHLPKTVVLSGDAADIVRKVRTCELSAVDVAREYVERARTDKNGAYITVMSDAAEKAARHVDECVARGEYLPLAGVPLAVKDNICTAGTLTTCASKALEDFVPDYDATVYARLIAAGAVPVGKTNLDEFAVGSDGSTSYFGKCRNPLDPTKTPGGSSSGSAAALADGSAVIALGSDTGGSARIPASYCGLAALKPTYGSFSRFGLVGMAPSLEQICPMARRVADLRAVFEVCAERDARDMTTFEEHSMHARKGRVGVFKPSEVSEAAKTAVERCASALESDGFDVNEISLPYFEDVLGIYYTISSAEASSNLARYDGLRYGYSRADSDITETRSDSFGAPLRERLAEGAYVLNHKNGGAYSEALRLREKLRERFKVLFEEYDIIVTPMADGAAAEFGLSTYNDERYAVYANLTGVPAVTFPAAKDCALPVGVQLMASWGDDIFLLDTAEKAEGMVSVC